MIIFKQARDLQQYLDNPGRRDKTLGFAPTMGALHQGHISLIEASRSRCDLTLCSIFVNPTQFNDPADFAKYPVTMEADIALLEKAGCDILFLPSVEEMYPEGLTTSLHYPLGRLEEIYEGRHRPGHFQGVCRIVHKLLDATQPHLLFLGQKDYQQCMVIEKLIQLRNMPVKVEICPTLREENGLAMSSRNARLSPEERKQAAAISEAMREIAQQINPGNTAPFTQRAAQKLADAGFRVDYFDIADAITLEPVAAWDGQHPLVMLVAAFLGEVRLIDNGPIPAKTS
jgi:pantoate--beta-alanine ligase